MNLHVFSGHSVANYIKINKSLDTSELDDITFENVLRMTG